VQHIYAVLNTGTLVTCLDRLTRCIAGALQCANRRGPVSSTLPGPTLQSATDGALARVFVLRCVVDTLKERIFLYIHCVSAGRWVSIALDCGVCSLFVRVCAYVR
jgi:hypothetical protein